VGRCSTSQRDGRPAEYRWCSLFNAAKFGSRPLLEYRAVINAANTRTPLKLAGVPQTTVPYRSPYCEDVWRRYCYLTSFFPIVDMCIWC